MLLEESERIKIDLVNFFHGKNECSVDVLRCCLFYVLLKPNLFKKTSNVTDFILILSATIEVKDSFFGFWNPVDCRLKRPFKKEYKKLGEKLLVRPW